MLEKEKQSENNAIYLKKIQTCLYDIEQTDSLLKNRWLKERFFKGLAIGLGGALGTMILPFVNFGNLIDLLGVLGACFLVRYHQSLSGSSIIREDILKRRLKDGKELSYLLEMTHSYKDLIEKISINIKGLIEVNQKDINAMFHKQNHDVEEINILIKSLKKQLLHIEYVLKEEENINNKDNLINMIVFIDKFFIKETKQLVKKLQLT